MAISRTNVGYKSFAGNPGGPDTHEDLHQRGAALEAAEPLFAQNYYFFLNNLTVNQVIYYNTKRKILYYSRTLKINIFLFQMEILMFT